MDTNFVELKEICKKITKGTTPTTIGGKFSEEGINFIKSESLNYDGSIDTTKFVKIDIATHALLKRSQIETNDILYSIAGVNLGKCGSAKAEHLPANTNQAVAIIRVDPQKADPKYIEYYLRNLSFVSAVNSSVAQSAQPNVNLTEIGNFKINLPSIERQKDIVSILSILDEKIWLNQHINITLEAITRTLFKSWFVDYDPVRLKLEGSQPFGMDKETTSLFPDSMEDSVLGKIPKGWRFGKLEDCCERVENGGTPRKDESIYWEPGTIPWLTSGEVRQGIVTFTKNYISEEGFIHSSAKMWPKETTVVALYGATAGQSCFLAEEMCANQACCGLIPKDSMRYYLFLYVSSSVEAFERQARGSAQQNLSQQIVADFPILVVDIKILNLFNDIVSPLFNMWINNLQEISTLAAIRDTLLPKLLSGEIRVKDAEKYAEALL